MKDEHIIIGAIAFNNETGSIDFLGIHPQYRKKDIVKAFMQKALSELLKDVPISITTFREGDKADLEYRKVFQNSDWLLFLPLQCCWVPLWFVFFHQSEHPCMRLQDRVFYLANIRIYLACLADTTAFF